MNVHDSKNNVPICSKKRRRQEETEHNYKGIVHQQNGNWGAQIYAKHHRYWLGTFKTQEEAAQAYESAALKLRTDNSRRNLDCTVLTLQEIDFQKQFTLEAILSMIKDGSYQPKFQEFLRVQREKGQPTLPDTINLQTKLQGDKNFSCVPLFQKELTPSDVGKLNRLVIPKKYAVKYLPRVRDSDNVGSGVVGDGELVIFDKLMKPWKFRYIYWTSSQSYVFTRGWNRFVKERLLKEKDIVSFYACTCNGGQQFYLIDVTYTSGPLGMVNGIDPKQPEGVKELQLELEVKNEIGESEKGYGENKVLRTKLFGVLIEKENCSLNIPS